MASSTVPLWLYRVIERDNPARNVSLNAIASSRSESRLGANQIMGSLVVQALPWNKGKVCAHQRAVRQMRCASTVERTTSVLSRANRVWACAQWSPRRRESAAPAAMNVPDAHNGWSSLQCNFVVPRKIAWDPELGAQHSEWSVGPTSG